MTDAEHFRKLEQLYAAAPISQWYGATAAIGDGHTEVSFAIRPEFHHAAHAVHGSFLTVGLPCSSCGKLRPANCAPPVIRDSEPPHEVG